MAKNPSIGPLGYSDKRAEDVSISATNTDLYYMILNRLTDMATSTFEWEGLPDTVDRRYLERTLFLQGTAMMYVPLGTNTVVATGWLPGSGQFDGYGNVINPVGVDYNGRQHEVEPGAWEVLYDTDSRRALAASLDVHARLIYKTYQTYLVNLQHQNTPYIVAGEKNDMPSIRAFFQRLMSFDPVIEVRRNQGDDISKKITTVDTKVPFIGGELLDARQRLWDMAISDMGIAAESAKKERLLTDEITMNRQEDMITLNARLKTRSEFCERINAKLGTNISVNVAKTAVRATAMMDHEADAYSGAYDTDDTEDNDE